MADAVVSALAQTVVGNLNSLVSQEIGNAWRLTGELKKLERTLATIQGVLKDAELKQRNSEEIQNWLMNLKDVSYDAENVLDEVATEGLRRRADSERGMQHQLKSFLSLRNPLLFRFKMAHKVKNVREKLDSIAEERHQLGLSDQGVVGNRYGVTLDNRQTNSLVEEESEIYGRKEEKEMIIKEIVGSGREQDDLSVYAIWGMGGLGKTTLAKLVYNDARIEKHFELRIWVCVSDDFNTERLVREIIESIEGGGCSVSGSDPLQCLLREKLRGRKFLLVLDDVWNEDNNMWDGLKQVLRYGSKGSMLMVTTRIEKVALMMGTMAPFNIGNLSEDDSWSLFKQRAFKTEEVDENLVAMGKVIVKKCGGVPLAIKALGSLMRFKSHESEWLAIKESEIWHLPDDENRILPALRLSYDNLMPHMRQCFAYCCIFPKDHEMGENQLVQLWMANGFIPSEGQTDLHLVGHLIFKELVWRSFFQDGEINFRGERMFKMHDLMHDLALSVMKHETYILEDQKVSRFPKMLRHLGLELYRFWAIPENESKLNLPIGNSLRSLIVHKGVFLHRAQGFLSFLSKQHHLRVLVMNHSESIVELPNLVCKLVHLRNLTMSCNGLKKLPESLTCLRNLQSLKLTHSEELLELPKRLNVLKNLWFLEIDDFDSLRCTPPGLGDLNCLRRLSIFIVGRDASHQINQLKELNLEGKLSIQDLENVRSLEDAKSANLMTKRNLTSLSLSWKKGINKNSLECFEEVLEGLQPHENLEKMCISSYQGSRFPNWMSTLAFKHLKEISLEYCERCEHPLPLGKLPSLSRLTLTGMDSVKHLGAEWYGNGERSFPALASLSIRKMPNLEEWNVPDSVESFPCLRDLRIEGCPKLIKLPFLPTLKKFVLHTSSVTLLESIMFLTLERLFIVNLPIRTLPKVLDNPSTLRALLLIECANLEFVDEGLQYLNSLKQLLIRDCPSITSFPAAILENLPSLTSLRLLDCKKLNPLSGPLRSGVVLDYLWIRRCPELKHLPESVQKLSCLKELRIYNCEGLRSLPVWLGSLQSLRLLEIIECPDLEKRCEKPNGEDWLAISHIPKILINSKIKQNLDI
ncbi:hypothetical protein BUALT_Bualt18G0053400 [Buddleja alternifolia]|uniref:Disease resistance protein RGA3 n=1 Tax=Buddleja alternifolia TaxID=168488 RepID=A0AAV6WD80_9LAMI|nr:hypothetical protein BUALT_Bualt18G0053400 [Buddleja alternifolia]